MNKLTDMEMEWWYYENQGRIWASRQIILKEFQSELERRNPSPSDETLHHAIANALPVSGEVKPFDIVRIIENVRRCYDHT